MRQCQLMFPHLIDFRDSGDIHGFVGHTRLELWISAEHPFFLHSDGPLFAFSLFTPSIINELGKYRHSQSFPTSDVCIGFTATKANLLSVPVYAWGCLMTLAIGVYADRLNKRCLVNVYAFSLSIYPFSVHDCPGVCLVSDWLDTLSLFVQGRRHYRILLFTLPFRESNT